MILHLLKQKPVNENWAVLVNEFGEIGVDRGLIEGQSGTRSDVIVAEVPGGCMCCAAGLPMQMALSQLFFIGEPDRLIIEPTGLGHPAEIVAVLASDAYQEQVELQTTIALVDPRSASQAQHFDHPSFIQQIAVADLILANKSDLASTADLTRLKEYVQTHCAEEVSVQSTQHGAVNLELLKAPSSYTAAPAPHHHTDPDYVLAADLPMPECGFVSAVNQGEGFESLGWRFSNQKIFDHAKTLAFLKGLHADRIKALLITNAGVLGYNITRSTFSEIPLRECSESRLEIISTKVDSEWQESLLNCLVNPQ
jgi:G3E family GTPase